jgi:hypothetical protein
VPCAVLPTEQYYLQCESSHGSAPPLTGCPSLQHSDPCPPLATRHHLAFPSLRPVPFTLSLFTLWAHHACSDLRPLPACPLTLTSLDHELVLSLQVPRQMTLLPNSVSEPAQNSFAILIHSHGHTLLPLGHLVCLQLCTPSGLFLQSPFPCTVPSLTSLAQEVLD